MARRAGLNHTAALRLSLRLSLLAVAVLLAHALVFEWLARLESKTNALRLMTAPIYTRLLQAEAPPAKPVQKREEPAARPPRGRVAIKALTPVAPEPSVSVPPSTPTVATIEEPAAVSASAPAVDGAAAANSATETNLADLSTGTNGAATAAASATATTANLSVAATTSTATSTVSPTATASATTTATSIASKAVAEAAPPSLDNWPGDTRLNYQLTGYFRGALLGSARVHWQRQGSRYQTRVEIEPNVPGSGRVLTSQGEVTPQGLLPGAYEELRLGKSRGARMGETTIVLADGREVPRPQGVQDSASQFVELSHRFASGKEVLEVGRAVSLWIARPGAVDLWTYDIVGREILKSAQLGEIETFRLKPRTIANARGNITAEMWFAPSLQYLPVRIRVSMGDEAFVDLMVNTIEQR